MLVVGFMISAGVGGPDGHDAGLELKAFFVGTAWSVISRVVGLFKGWKTQKLYKAMEALRDKAGIDLVVVATDAATGAD